MATRDERLAQFATERAPSIDECMELLCEDNSGTYSLPFACKWLDGSWLNSKTGVAIEARVIGWRKWE